MSLQEIDLANEKFHTILKEIQSYESTIITEQDARIKIIDRVLQEVLGWSPSDIFCEPKTDSGY